MNEGTHLVLYKARYAGTDCRRDRPFARHCIRNCSDEVLDKRATKRAMHLLEKHGPDRTGAVREKLAEVNIRKKLIDDAIAYVKKLSLY